MKIVIMLVQKYGGGILANRDNFKRIVAIVEQTKPDIVVVSAVQGVTDALISLLETAGEGTNFEKQLELLREKHAAIVGREPQEMRVVFDELQRTLTGINYTGEYSDKLYAFVLSRGEYLSALALQSYLPEYIFWPSENGIAVKGSHLNARCDFKRCKKPPAKSIVTGFYGLNEKNEVCLFGRGGSDYSAGAIAHIINAEKVEFWKNTAGFMTADPHVVANSKRIDALSFDEASELSRFGAKILHPSALEPLNNGNIEVEVRNVLTPEKRGTIITRSTTRNEIAAITGRKNLAVVSVSGNEMVEAFGIAAKILSRVADANVPVDAIATAQANISFTIGEKNCEKTLDALIGLDTFTITSKRELALVAVVGNAIKRDPSFTARVFNALSHRGIAVEMISQGASEIDLSIVVKQREYEEAISAIHSEFFEK